ncbi:MAG: 30S ribosomal protein S6 [Pseudomonadota bacterium]
MALYEHIFMVRQDASSAQVEALTDQFKTVLTENGGSVGKAEYWGIKSLTYRIKKNRKAHYSLLNIDAPSAAVSEMERQMRLSEDVIRFMTIKVEEHEEEPSVMMRSRSQRDDRPRRKFDDDRGPRGDRDERPARAEAAAEKPAEAAAPAKE